MHEEVVKHRGCLKGVNGFLVSGSWFLVPGSWGAGSGQDGWSVIQAAVPGISTGQLALRILPDLKASIVWNYEKDGIVWNERALQFLNR